ncbi:MAG: 50S ribosomal protein L30 [Firmicutes bacterium]|jgi:large subunit ribosomal protein L30|nr:50S ribosomal protein L30 [Lachnospiraceae bacterium]MBQ1580094.1 50S ribosomal protein L30 [Bacillota bacterium]MBQ2147617.1 50S ribosomal protein L30 [Bacillota bacterium]MBQ2218604.1 50S ribosomal protein L30 [Bacillota bacterium]MBQ2228630.1 50S ribosomal protein L30 [Bacillota bacterium]
MGNLKITLVKSTIGETPYQKKVVKALGLTKLNKSVELPDTPQTRGAVNKVSHLLKVEEL